MKTLRLFVEVFRISAKALRANPLRSILTMLGISVGIFVITAIFTFVDSMVYSVENSMETLGDRVIFVHKFAWTMDTEADWRKMEMRRDMRYKDYIKLRNSLEYADAVSFQADMVADIKYEGNSIKGITLIGVAGDYTSINDFKLAEGRLFSNAELDGGRSVCVIGANVAATLFVNEDVIIGKTIRAEGKKLKIIGILEKVGGQLVGDSPDDRMFVPYSFLNHHFNDTDDNIDNVISARARSREDIPWLEGEVVGLMRSSRGLRPVQEDDFSVNKPEQMMKELDSLVGIFRIGGFIISIFSILVGGFGIGNIMFTTVKERTFEIGLQKALGSTRGFILSQFLVESVMLCLLGGLAGLGFTWVFGQVVELILDAADVKLEIVMSTFSIVFSIIISASIGVLSGFIPSILAARLDPVESMRK